MPIASPAESIAIRHRGLIALVALATCIAVLLLACYMHLANPDGLLLYTPVAGEPRPKGAPALPIGLVLGFGLLSLAAMALLLLGAVIGALLRLLGIESALGKINLYCLVAFVVAATSIPGLLVSLVLL
jgi:hypothetical protein